MMNFVQNLIIELLVSSREVTHRRGGPGYPTPAFHEERNFDKSHVKNDEKG